MPNKKNNRRGRRHKREARQREARKQEALEREAGQQLGFVRGLLSRALDRVRAWLGDTGASGRVRRGAQRARGDSRQPGRTGGERPRGQETGARGRGGRDRGRGAYPLSFVPSAQTWPWNFMGRTSPWPPGPEMYYQQLLPPGVRGRPLGRRGRHTGRGPRGYSRPDARIVEDINEALTYSPHIDASDIEIRVDHGDVTVSGSVDDRYLKRLVEDIIEDVSGVRDVHNRLRVERREVHRAGGMSRASGREEPRELRRDMTIGQDIEELEVSNLNTGRESCARKDEGGSFSGT